MFERGQLGNNTPGALCYIKSLNINHNIENADSAVFTGIANDGKATYHNIIPQLIEINLEFTVIHEEFMGHQDGVQAASVYGLSDDYSTAAESYRRSLQRSLGITDADAVRAEASPETQALQDTVDALHAEYMSTSQLRLQIQDLQSAEIVAGSTYGFDSQQALDLRSQLTTLENRLADEIAISTLNRAGTYENLERDGQGWVEGAEPDGSNMVLGSAIGYIPEE